MRFLPVLAEDEGTPAAIQTTAVLNEELERLLQSDASSFWATVQEDQSLHICLDTYLRHKRWDGMATELAHRCYEWGAECTCFLDSCFLCQEGLPCNNNHPALRRAHDLLRPGPPPEQLASADADALLARRVFQVLMRM